VPFGGGRQLGVAESLFAPGTANFDDMQLATDWELASDQSTITITIRDGVKFHGDWGDVTAEDMAWVINRTNPAINPESIAASAANLTSLFGDTPVTASGNTITGTFENFDVRWASNILNQEASGGLTTFATSKKAFDEKGKDWLKDNFVGTGPMQVKVFKPGVSVTMEKVPYDHWRKNASIDEFTLLAVPEESIRVAMMQTGEIDVAYIAPKDLKMMASGGYLQVSAGQGQQEGVMFPGNLWESTNAITGEVLDLPSHGVYVRAQPWTGNPWTPDDGDNPAGMDDMEQARLVRQALARGVDRDAINTYVVGGVGTPVHVTYFSTKNKHWDSKWEYPYDVAKANAMLDEAGYPKGDDGIRFQIPLFVGPELGGGAGPAGEIGDAIAGYWQELGLDVQVLKYAYGVFRPGLVSRTTVVPMLTGCDDGQETYPFDWPKGLVQTTLTRGGFSCGFESPDILGWYQSAAKEADMDKRVAINKEYLEYMHHWALFPGYITVPNAFYANPNHIKEWPMNLGNSYNSPENIVLK
jgi:peptide/nickel transport system substrate-binding protein